MFLNTFDAYIYIYIDCSAGDLGSIPGLGRSLEKRMAMDSSFLAWRILWIEEPGSYCPWGHKQLNMTEATQHACMHFSAAFLGFFCL